MAVLSFANMQHHNTTYQTIKYRIKSPWAIKSFQMIRASFVESVIAAIEWSDAASEASIYDHSNSNTGNDDKDNCHDDSAKSQGSARS